MTTPNIDVVKLQQAITEFGSLQKAIEVLVLRKEEIEAETLTTTRNLDVKKNIKTQLINENNELNNEYIQLDNSIE